MEEGLIVFCLTLFCYGFFEILLVEASFNKPQILVNGNEEILEVNSNHSIFCQGNKPVQWKLPEITERNASWTTFRMEETKPTSTYFQYGNRLHITNMTHPFVGFYYCQYKNAKDPEERSSIYINVEEEAFEKPQILLVNGTEKVLEVNGNDSFLCQGNRPVHWKLPKIEKRYASWTTFEIEEVKPTNLYGRYGSRLHVTNMTFPFVGFYYCVYENVDNIEEGSRIYLYVDDTENLSVTSDLDDELNGGTLDIIYGRQFETAIIPCRPTSPYVDVTLKEVSGDGEPVPLDVLLKNGAFVHFNRFFGFITNDTADINQKLYLCSFSRDYSNPKYKGVQIISEKSKSTIATPFIEDNNNGHTTVGQNLSLTCSVHSEITIDFQWRGPHGPIDEQFFINSNNDEYTSTLQIDKTGLDDSGVYTCYVSDHQHHSSNSSINVKIFGLNEHNLTMAEMNNQYYIQTYAGKEYVKWTVYFWGHPHPQYTWSNNRNITISKRSSGKYDIEFKNDYLTLTINYVNISDLGHYTLTGANSYEKKTLDFFLNVTDKPSVTMETESFHMLGTPGKVNCTASAHPAPIFQWGYKPCLRDDCILQQIESTIIEEWDVVFVSQVEINTTEPVGLLKCIATNFIGSDESTIQYIVSDFENGFSMTGFDESVVFDESGKYATFAIGHPVKVKCGASVQKYKNIVWLLNDSPLQANDKYKITHSMTDYSYISYLEIEDVKYEDTGNYSCRVEVKSSNGKSSFRNKTMRFLMEYPTKPNITGSEKKETIERNYPQEAELYCEVYGVPKPKITWYKSGSEFDPDGSRILLKNENQVLRFNQTSEQDEASYECRAQNEEGKVSKTWNLKIKNKGGSSVWYFVIIVVLFVICLVTVSCIVVKVRKEKRLQRELKLLGLANFEKGAVENINPELGLDDQAELLPYDKKWEFPIEQLKLGKQLGSGAFGVVMKGEAKHIVEGEPLTTVAVKMVKKNADHIYIKALASELKIMVHLGQHLNVVNLLGACTKNVVKKELLVIVEYCRYGNLQNYLLRHRDNFVNQVDPKNGKLNYTLGQDILDRTYSVSSNRSETQSPLLKYAALAFSNKSNGPILPPSSSMGDYRAKQNSGGSDTTDMTAVSQSNEIVLSNNSIQPEWRSNYKGDYRGNVKPISTKDLVAWSFQVARGMDYLSSRKVLHGDLAARNILLSDDNIVKICDFGLAKTMYKNDNYKKRSDCPLPVKWMAIESIRDRIFSTQSDAWSFGIVLWELFSLARTPYPGMEADERLYHKLVEGYRMEAPEYAPKEIYDLMTDCWKSQPLERPSFSKLTERLGNLLEDTIRKYYIDLNDPYLAMNTKLIEDGKSDYLAMVSPPTFEALSSPHQLHDSSDDGYMSMNPGGIFSPRVTEGEIFDFNIPNRKPLSSEGGTGHELLPMLHILSESDSETPLTSPNPNGVSNPNPNGVSNPSYQLPPSITQEKIAPSGEIVKSADNYVNMPQNKSILREKANADEKSDKVVEHNYVNGDIRDWESVGV